MKKKFFKDPKINQISCKDFFLSTNFLRNCKNNWNSKNLPIAYIPYYRITENLLIKIVYRYRLINYGMDMCLAFDHIDVAFRDGLNEYNCFLNDLKDLKQESIKHPKSKKILQNIKNLTNNINYIKRKLPAFTKMYELNKGDKEFKDSLVKNLYKANDKNLSRDYVVLDLETNGLRSANDDLLSISIYDPLKGVAYNRFLPLELQPVVLTGYMNQITEEKLNNEFPISQNEFDQIVNFFNLKQRTILTYSGGSFDYKFLFNYFKRHNILGLENLKFKNIKEYIASNTTGNLTKDNVCNMLNIEGVTEFHTSLNDCVLEWKLFEKIYKNRMVVINENCYLLSQEYMIPASYLIQFNYLAEIMGIKMPKINYKFEKIFEYNFAKTLLNKIQKFETNITGIEVEHLIYSLLNVSVCDNFDFLIKNKQKLKKIGSLETHFLDIPIKKMDDGSFIACNSEDELFVEKINKTTMELKVGIQPVIDFIVKNIFKNKTIKSQELVFYNRNIFTLCDLSDKYSVLEIKTYDIDNTIKRDNLAKQLYFQSKGREMFTLTISYDMSKFQNLKNLNFKIYKLLIQEDNES